MADTPQEIIDRELREFKRYTGDGLPGEPVNAPLPVGDPQSGVHNPKKANLRNALKLPLEEGAEQADRAEAAADRAAGYVNDIVAEKEVPIYSTISGMSSLAVPDGMGRIYVSGQSTVGDGLGGMFIDADNGSPVAFTSVAGDGATARDWYRAGDVSAERLAPAFRLALTSLDQQAAYFGKVVTTFGITFPDYDDLLSSYGYRYLYPQGFYEDEISGERIISYAPNDDTNPTDHNRWTWFVRRDLSTNEYLGCFSAGMMFAEGMGVRYEGGVRYLFANDGNQSIGKYSLAGISNKERLTAVSTYSADADGHMAYREGEFLVEQFTTLIGTYRRKYLLGRFDTDFNRVGNVDFGIIQSGDNRNTATCRTLPKAQGTAIGDGFIARAYGGIWTTDSEVTGYVGTGVRIFDRSGQKLIDGIMRPDALRTILLGQGIPEITRIECEGVHVTSDNRVRMLICYLGSESSSSMDDAGVMILEMFSKDAGAIDFRSSAMQTSGFDLALFQSQLLRKMDGGKVFNPLTGEEWTNVNQLCDFMADLDIGQISWYSSTVTLLNVDDSSILPVSYCNLWNGNNGTFFLDIRGSTYTRRYGITGSPRSLTNSLLTTGGAAPGVGEPSVHFDTGGGGGARIVMSLDSDEGQHLLFRSSSGNAGAISSSGSTTTYGTSSDSSLKDDDGDLSFEQASAVLAKIKFHNFRWKKNNDPDHGVFAQELFEIYPRAVVPGGWFLSDGTVASEAQEGAEYVPWQVDYSKLMTVVARCVQGLLEASKG